MSSLSSMQGTLLPSTWLSNSSSFYKRQAMASAALNFLPKILAQSHHLVTQSPVRSLALVLASLGLMNEIASKRDLYLRILRVPE